MGYGMGLVTFQPQFRIFIKITKIFMQVGKATWLFFIADLDELSVSKSRGTKKKGPVFLQSQNSVLTLEKDWAFQFLIK